MTLAQFIEQKFNLPVSVNDLNAFVHERVFFNVCNAPAIPAGGSQQATPGDSLIVPVSTTPLGPMVVLYVDAADARLGKPFAGVLLDEAIQIVHAMQAVKGLVLQGNQESALVIEKSSSDEVKSR